MTNVPSIYSLLMQIPDELKPWVAIGIGSLILVCLVLFHGTGIHWILQIHRRGEKRLLEGRPHIASAIVLFGGSVFLMLSLHLMGVLAWAFILSNIGFIQKTNDAIYFCANAYTTLGYGSVDLDPLWRNISPIIGISGLFTFAWTTSVLVNIVTAHNRLLEQLHIEHEKETALRAGLRASIEEVRKKERGTESALRAVTREKESATGLWQRWGTWQGERRKIVQMRESELEEVAELFRKERKEEAELGPGESDKRD